MDIKDFEDKEQIEIKIPEDLKVKEKTKRIFKDWNLFELLLLMISMLTIIFSSIIVKSEILTITTSLFAVYCALLQAKGKVLSQFIGLIVVILYSIVSFKNRYYGEVIIYIFILFPLYTTGIISWIRNKNEDTDTVNKNIIHKKEWICLIIINIILFIVLYYILKYFNTNQLLVSTMSMIASLNATYLIVRRNKYSFLFYILNDIILIILWGTPVIQGNLQLIPILIDPLVLVINDIYGWKKWNQQT